MDAQQEADDLEKRLSELNSEYIALRAKGDVAPDERRRMRDIDKEHTQLNDELSVMRRMAARTEANRG